MLVVTGIWILLALGLSVVVGMAGLLDLGYVAFFMLGAYTTAFMTPSGGEDQFHIVEWPNVGGAALRGSRLRCLAGVVLGVPTLRLRGDYLAIVTLGFHEIVRQTANNLTITNGSRGIPGIERPSLGLPLSLGGINTSSVCSARIPTGWFLLIPAIILAVIMIRHLEDSRVGRYWTAIREDEVAASAMGVPVVKMKVLAFVIGASTSGVAGWIFAVLRHLHQSQQLPASLFHLDSCRGRDRRPGEHLGSGARRNPGHRPSRDRPRSVGWANDLRIRPRDGTYRDLRLPTDHRHDLPTRGSPRRQEAQDRALRGRARPRASSSTSRLNRARKNSSTRPRFTRKPSVRRATS